jgi:hypothetical protein
VVTWFSLTGESSSLSFSQHDGAPGNIESASAVERVFASGDSSTVTFDLLRAATGARGTLRVQSSNGRCIAYFSDVSLKGGPLVEQQRSYDVRFVIPLPVCSKSSGWHSFLGFGIADPHIDPSDSDNGKIYSLLCKTEIMYYTREQVVREIPADGSVTLDRSPPDNTTCPGFQPKKVLLTCKRSLAVRAKFSLERFRVQLPSESIDHFAKGDWRLSYNGVNCNFALGSDYVDCVLASTTSYGQQLDDSNSCSTLPNNLTVKCM